jgi:1-acyl-sn-glycerol-3-phosphate acyltransferase
MLNAWGFDQAPWGFSQAPWGLNQARLGRRLLRALARPPSAEFARQMCAFDEAVAVGGLRAGGAMLCRRYAGGVRAAGLEHVPTEGPALILSNHPGLCDTVALFAAIPRRDLRVIALDRPFLRALPNTARHLDLLPDDANARAGVTRAVARYLRDGGAALTFPAGHIEPDPLTLPGAEASLDAWSESIGLFTRLVPQMTIVVAMVGGVYTPAALRNPLTGLRRRRADRELLAAALQLAWRPYQRNVIDVAFAAPLRAAGLLARDSDPVRITRAITDRARQVLVNWPAEWSTVV